MKTSDSRYCKCMYFVSNALARKVEKLANNAWKKTGLSPSHAYLLMIVIDNPGVQAGTLSEELQLSPSTITRLIEKLEEKKMLLRTAEGKMTRVFPSAKGRDMKPVLKECLDVFYKSYATILGKEESMKLVQSMNKVADKL
jgi:MarR family transcriptional regulator, organic hydroperoxide resistance regulator